ncbi:MAG TPA: cache domain-containing protein [Bacillus sp. (in: firmicutes)]|nr:cache domain-containing protein [Bacillus sp. (in: firmicutes)]
MKQRLQEKWNLKNKLIIIFVAILTVPSITIGVLSYQSAKQEIENKLILSAEENVDLLDEILTDAIHPIVSEVAFLAEEVDASLYEEGESPRLREIFSQYIALRDEMLSVYVGTNKGLTVQEPRSEPVEDYDPRERPWYKEAMAEKGKVVITNPYVSTSGDVIVSIVKAVHDSSGVVGIDLNLNKVSKLTQTVKIGNEGYAFIVDKNRNYISHPTLESGSEATGDFLDNLYQTKAGYFEYELNGVDQKMSYQTNKLTGWKIAGTMYANEAEKSAQPIYLKTTLVVVFSLIIGALIIYFIVTSIDALVRQLKEKTKQLESTHLKLLESQQKYKSLFDNHTDAIFSVNREGKIFSINQGCVRVSGYSVEEWMNRRFDEWIIPEDIAQVTTYYQNALRGKTESFSLGIVHKNGQMVEVDLTFVPIAVNSEVVGIYGIAKDVTEKKKTEKMLMKSEKLSVVSRLAAGVAHEIRNPLTTIKGFLQLLHTNKGALKQEYMDLVLSELNRVEMIIYEFLNLAKPHHESVFKRTDINKTLHAVTQLLRTNATLNGIEIITVTDDEVPMIECVDHQLKQVFINLIKNAVEATKRNESIYIQVKKIDEEHVRIRFIDHGCGIPEERLHMLGEPFYSTKEQGTGLGLMVSFKIIENHNGHIYFSSKVNEGTTVDIILPVSQAQKVKKAM